MDYVRIGTTYYKKVRNPLASCDLVELLMAWLTECIKQDHGKHFLSNVPRFDGFCLIPDHLNYKREIENFTIVTIRSYINPCQAIPHKYLSFSTMSLASNWTLAWIT